MNNNQTHHQSRYQEALASETFKVFEALAYGAATKHNPEIRLKFQVAVWVAEKRALPRSFSIPDMADYFRLTNNGMRQHLDSNPLILRLPPPTRAIGSPVYLNEWLLDIVAPR